jgi:hypothetical protein
VRGAFNIGGMVGESKSKWLLQIEDVNDRYRVTVTANKVTSCKKHLMPDAVKHRGKTEQLHMFYNVV